MNQPRIAAVILAAGAASRFGSPKQLANFRGEPMLMRTIRHAREGGVSQVVVVLGAHADVVAASLPAASDVITVLNQDWSSGVASSIRAGLAAVQPDSVDAVLLLAVDQPLISRRELCALLDVFAAGGDIVASEYGGVTGVPVLVASRYLADLTGAISGDRGAGTWLRSQGERVTRVRMDAAASDADTVEALSAIENVSGCRST